MLSRFLSILLATSLSGLADPGALSLKPAGLTMAVLQGNQVIHTLPNPSLSHISIRVSDGDGKPIQNAVAVFEFPELGASAAFPDGSQVKVLLTNKDGDATVEIRANTIPGQFEPKVTVNYLGQTNTISLKHENAFDPAVRPAAYHTGLVHKLIGSGSGKKGGLSKETLLLISGAAVAGVVVVAMLAKGHGGNRGGGITITPGTGTVGGN